jgi:hypothetical protein
MTNFLLIQYDNLRWEFFRQDEKGVNRCKLYYATVEDLAHDATTRSDEDLYLSDKDKTSYDMFNSLEEVVMTFDDAIVTKVVTINKLKLLAL